jgi:hypothetical protein
LSSTSVEFLHIHHHGHGFPSPVESTHPIQTTHKAAQIPEAINQRALVNEIRRKTSRDRKSAICAIPNKIMAKASGCNEPATPGNCMTDARIQAEIVRVVKVLNWQVGINNLFVVYTAAGEGSCMAGTAD